MGFYNKKDLIISADDWEFKKASKKFLEDLRFQHKQFVNEINKESEVFKSFCKKRKKKKIHFYPEILCKKSGIGLINAPWGSGKTYFIEALAKRFYLDPCADEHSYFETIVIINAWKFSASDSIPSDVIQEIVFKLTEISGKANKIILLQIAKKLFNATVLNWTNRFLGTDFSKIDTKKSVEDLIKSYNKNNKIKPILIFLDNLERVGSASWDFLKAITKLSELNKIIFILPMHLPKMHANEPVGSSEYPIEKYLDFSIWNFKQDYYSLFKSFGFREDTIKILKRLFSNPDKETSAILTIREIKQRIQNSISNLNNKMNKFEILSNIVNLKIWGDFETAKKIISWEVEEAYKLHKNILKNFNFIIGIKEEIIDFFSYEKEIQDFILKTLNKKIPVFFTHSKLGTIKKEFNDYVTKKRDKLNKDLSALESKDTEYGSFYDSLNKDIENLENQIKTEKNKRYKSEISTKKIVGWQEEIELKKEIINTNTKDSEENYSKLNFVRTNIKNLDDLLQKLHDFQFKLNEKITNFNNLIEEWNKKIDKDVQKKFNVYLTEIQSSPDTDIKNAMDIENIYLKLLTIEQTPKV